MQYTGAQKNRKFGWLWHIIEIRENGRDKGERCHVQAPPMKAKAQKRDLLLTYHGAD